MRVITRPSAPRVAFLPIVYSKPPDGRGYALVPRLRPQISPHTVGSRVARNQPYAATAAAQNGSRHLPDPPQAVTPAGNITDPPQAVASPQAASANGNLLIPPSENFVYSAPIRVTPLAWRPIRLRNRVEAKRHDQMH